MDKKRYLHVTNVYAYKIAFNLSQYIWDLVGKWDYFSKKTIGTQYVSAADSISANIAEGWGRHHKKDKIKFFYNARGSYEEVKDWTRKAYKRGLLNESEHDYVESKLERLPKEINFLIYITNKKLSV